MRKFICSFLHTKHDVQHLIKCKAEERQRGRVRESEKEWVSEQLTAERNSCRSCSKFLPQQQSPMLRLSRQPVDLSARRAFVNLWELSALPGLLAAWLAGWLFKIPLASQYSWLRRKLVLAQDTQAFSCSNYLRNFDSNWQLICPTWQIK